MLNAALRFRSDGRASCLHNENNTKAMSDANDCVSSHHFLSPFRRSFPARFRFVPVHRDSQRKKTGKKEARKKKRNKQTKKYAQWKSDRMEKRGNQFRNAFMMGGNRQRRRRERRRRSKEYKTDENEGAFYSSVWWPCITFLSTFLSLTLLLPL